METPHEKNRNFHNFLNKSHMFTSASKINTKDFIFRHLNSSSNFKENNFNFYNSNLLNSSNYRNKFSFSKNFLTSSRQNKLDKSDCEFFNLTDDPKKLMFSNCSIKFSQKAAKDDHSKEVHKLNISRSQFKINNINFNINLGYLR